MLITAAASFAALDWLVFAAYLSTVLVVGLLAARRNAGENEIMLAGRSMPTWAVALSLLATMQSAATFIGGPQQAYAADLTYLTSNIGSIIAAIIVATLFVPVFYRQNVRSVYEVLGGSIGSRAQQAASVCFLLGRVLASGARLYIVAIPFSMIVFGDLSITSMMSSIAIIISVVTVYVAAGGIRAVIWTDVLQCGVYVVTIAVAMWLLCSRFPDGPVAALQALAESEHAAKLTLIDTSWSLQSPFTIWATLSGLVLFMIAALAVDQDLAQRVLTCKSARRGSWSVIAGTLIGWPVVAMFMLVGLLLFVYFKHPELVGMEPPPYLVDDDTRKVFLLFILEEMPVALRGLMLAGLFAAAMSSTDSALNAMASTIVADLLPPCDESQQRRQMRLAVVLCSALLASFACLCVIWQQHSNETIINFALGVMVFAYSGLLAVFLTAMFTRRGNSNSAIAAMLVGASVVLVMRVAPDRLHGMPATAFPWQMLLGTALAFVTCVAGRRR